MVEKRSPLGWLGLLLPHDSGVERIASDVSFGDHARQSLDIYRHKNAAAQLPVVMFIYGGGWNSGTKADYDFAGRAFAAAGYVVVIADYRTVPEITYPTFLDDGAAALNWTVENIAAFGGDPERLFLVGHSAGAYNAVMLGLDAGRFGAGDVSACIRGVVGLSGPYDFYPFDVDESIAAFSNSADPMLTQPINLVHKDAPPMFLGHGLLDRICLPRNSKALAAKLRDANIDVVEHYYEGAAHPLPLLALMRPLRWRLPIFKQIIVFLKEL